MAVVYYCQTCGYRTSTTEGLTRNTGSCCGNNGYKCPRCPRSTMRQIGTVSSRPGPGQPGFGRYQGVSRVRKKK